MKSKHFKIQELVPKEMYETMHEDLLWNMLDSKLIISIDAIKEHFPKGLMIINNYAWGGDREWSGIRTKDSKYYSEGSRHSIGKAVDIVFSQYSTEEVRNYILDTPEYFAYIKGIEVASWLHIDVRDSQKVVVFYN